MTKNDDKCVPALRFKGFNNDWAQQELKDLVSFYSGLTYHPEDIKSTGVFVIRSSNIKHGQLVNADNVYVDPKSVNSTYVRKKDIIVVVRNGSRNLIGKHAQVHNDISKSVIGAFMTGIRSNNNDFISALFDSDKFRKEIHKNLGATINQITTGEFKKMIFLTPQTLNEKEKIGNLISQINSLVSLQQRKLQQLKLLKKAMLQDLFTDKNVPKLRFNGFDANWIQCKLEKEALLTMGQSPSGSTYSDQPSTYILVQGNADLKNGWVKPRIWTTQITKLAKKGDIIITVRAPAGKVGRTNFDVVLGRGVASIQGNDFIFYLLSKMDMNKYWKKYAAGSTFESINSNDIKNTRVHVPNLPEQNRIANLFLRLDDLIRFQQNKLNNLQKTKQFLLQNMFI